MLHPATELRYINPNIGYGVFATAFIPCGTIIYVQDALEIVLPPDDPRVHDPRYASIIKKYAYEDETHNQIISWDFAKHINHCCHANTLSTGYGFEIAIRDIQPGEEITDEYALFSPRHEMILRCHYADCRQSLQPGDLVQYGPQWDQLIQQALQAFPNVTQLLLPLLDETTLADLMVYLNTGQTYRPVTPPKLQPAANTLIFPS